jgi:hypothetical protein
MRKIDSIVKPSYIEDHQFLCDFIAQVEKQSIDLLSSHSFLENVIRKEVDFGLIFQMEKVPQSIFYNLEYTFFENIEDLYGGRENDVTLGIVIDYYPNGEFNISRDIISKYGDIDYSENKKVTNISNSLKSEINNMEADFLGVLQSFIKGSKCE